MLQQFKETVLSSEYGKQWKEIAQELCGRGATSKHICYYDLWKDLENQGYGIASVAGYGGEGLGDEYWGVFALTHKGETQLFKISGWYASYDGATIDEWNIRRVYAKEKVIIVYE